MNEMFEEILNAIMTFTVVVGILVILIPVVIGISIEISRLWSKE